MMSGQVETFIQQPDAPNLYWALTQLPDPVVDICVAWKRNRPCSGFGSLNFATSSTRIFRRNNGTRCSAS